MADSVFSKVAGEGASTISLGKLSDLPMLPPHVRMLEQYARRPWVSALQDAPVPLAPALVPQRVRSTRWHAPA